MSLKLIYSYRSHKHILLLVVILGFSQPHYVAYSQELSEDYLSKPTSDQKAGIEKRLQRYQKREARAQTAFEQSLKGLKRAEKLNDTKATQIARRAIEISRRALEKIRPSGQASWQMPRQQCSRLQPRSPSPTMRSETGWDTRKASPMMTSPLVGRIVSLADAFDALTSRRPYKDPFPVEGAIDIIKKVRGNTLTPRWWMCFWSTKMRF